MGVKVSSPVALVLFPKVIRHSFPRVILPLDILKRNNVSSDYCIFSAPAEGLFLQESVCVVTRGAAQVVNGSGRAGKS